MQALRYLRCLLRIQQSDVAKRACISVRELARIEAGEAYPSPKHARAIDEAFAAVIAERGTELKEGNV